ncbi:MAG: magnesium protoporphyrin IX methyltransferase [Roseobacter sp.]
MRDEVILSHPDEGTRAGYDATRARVETYFDRTATKTWERLTSDAPVSRIRQTVREGRDQMRDVLLGCLPKDLTGRRVLDAGCGAGQMSLELAKRGAEVVGVDISPALIEVASKRLPDAYRGQVSFTSGDMLRPSLGSFDHVIAMDSLIYYTAQDIGTALVQLEKRTSGNMVFTVAPRTRALMTMWYAGKLFPRSDRSPVMVPHAPSGLSITAKAQGLRGELGAVKRISKGFYISQAMEVRP